MSNQPNIEKLKLIAPDLRDNKQFPRSPRAKLGEYVLAARVVDKIRADLLGQIGEYHTDCPLDRIWLKFAEIDYSALRDFVATGASDDEVADWIGKNAKARSRQEIIVWNNQQRDAQLSDLPPESQETMEDVIAKSVPRHRVVYRFFDIFDLEEERL